MTTELPAKKAIDLPLKAWKALQELVNLGASVELTSTRFVLWSPLQKDSQIAQAIDQLYHSWEWVTTVPLEIGRRMMEYELNTAFLARIAAETGGNMRIAPLTKDEDALLKAVLNPAVSTEIRFAPLDADLQERLHVFLKGNHPAKIQVVEGGDDR